MKRKDYTKTRRNADRSIQRAGTVASFVFLVQRVGILGNPSEAKAPIIPCLWL